MANPDRNGQDKRPSLADLKARLAAARAARAEQESRAQPTAQVSMSGLALGWRLIAEMASAIFVGGLIGWYLDRWLGVSPGFLLGGLMLGIVTGIWNVWRTVQRLNARLEAEEKSAQASEDHKEHRPD